MHKSKYVKKKNLCSICKEEIYGWGHNPQPHIHQGKKLDVTDSCCDDCNESIVRQSRLQPNNSRKDLN